MVELGAYQFTICLIEHRRWPVVALVGDNVAASDFVVARLRPCKPPTFLGFWEPKIQGLIKAVFLEGRFRAFELGGPTCDLLA